MRNRFLFLFLLASFAAHGVASADPVQITGGSFALDIEGDMFSLHGSGATLTTTAIGIYSPKVLPGRCTGSGEPFGFCAEAEGDVVDWSFHTTGGEQLLGTGNVAIGGTTGTQVDFVGTMQFDVTPTPLSSGGTSDFDFVAPFTFGANIRGVENGQELFANEFTGQGFVRVNYEGTLRPGVFAAADESITYEFVPTQTPEPGTALLVGTAIVALARRRSGCARHIHRI